MEWHNFELCPEKKSYKVNIPIYHLKCLLKQKLVKFF